MNDQLMELERDLRDRALTYSFLARAFSDEEVTVDFLKALRADPPQTGTELDGYAAKLVGMGEAALETERKELAAEHSRLLLGMSAMPVSTFESVFESELHLMMQEQRDEVLKAYRRAGFAKAESYHVPEDHISLELDFVSALANRAADNVRLVLDGAAEAPAEGEAGPLELAERDMNALFTFLEEHLFVWGPKFCSLMLERSRTGFYKGVSQMLDLLLRQEKEYLDGLNAAQAQAE